MAEPAAEVVVDSTVIEAYLRGNDAACNVLDELRREGRLATHAVIVAELLSAAQNVTEQDALGEMFQHYQLVPPAQTDAIAAIELLQQFRMSHQVSYDTCLLAATCLRCGLPLMTAAAARYSTFDGLDLLHVDLR